MVRARKVSWREYPVNGVVRGLKDRDLWKGLRDKRMRTSPISPPTRINTVGNEVVKPTLSSMGLTPRKLSHRPPPGEDAALDTLQSFLASRGNCIGGECPPQIKQAIIALGYRLTSALDASR